MPPSDQHRPIGLLIPFRRDRKRDFATGSGPDLLAAKVRQVLLTEGATAHSSGEVPWRTSFGSALHLLRHRPNDAALAELARLHIRDALAHWLPEIELVAVSIELIDSKSSVHVSVRGVDRPVTRSLVEITVTGLAQSPPSRVFEQ